MNTHHNEFFRYGSASWASASQMRKSGLFDPKGLHIGFCGDNAIKIDGDAPLLLLGGAGSGKLRDTLAYTFCNSPGLRKIMLDPRGESAKIGLHNAVRHHEFAYCLNPYAILDLPQHCFNALDILKPDSRTLHPDAKLAAEGLIKLSVSGGGVYFERRARQWLEAILVTLTLRDGMVNASTLMQAINAIEGDPEHWADILEWMLASEHDDLKRTAGEMLAKQQDSEREFGSIMGELYGATSIFNDPCVRDALSGSDFSLEDFCDPDQVIQLYLNVPAEYLQQMAPALRLIFTVAMIYKGRKPEAPRLHLIVDEAGQLGRAEFLLRAFTYGRGAGVRAWAVFQDIGQIKRNFGPDAVSSFIGSAQTRIFYGVRDYETAKLVSDMLGMETLEYDDDLKQAEARSKRKQAFSNVLLQGADPIAEGAATRSYEAREHHRTKQTRHLMTPEEVLSMPEDRQVVFVSGKNLKPLYLEKHPYYERREMAGQYLANPYHPPADKVRVRTRFGSHWRKINHGPVPKKFSQYPQYSSGTWEYVEGYKPK